MHVFIAISFSDFPQNMPSENLGLVVSLGTGRPPTVPIKSVDVFRPDSLLDVARCAAGVSTLGNLILSQVIRFQTYFWLLCKPNPCLTFWLLETLMCVSLCIVYSKNRIQHYTIWKRSICHHTNQTHKSTMTRKSTYNVDLQPILSQWFFFFFFY